MKIVTYSFQGTVRGPGIIQIKEAITINIKRKVTVPESHNRFISISSDGIFRTYLIKKIQIMNAIMSITNQRSGEILRNIKLIPVIIPLPKPKPTFV